MEEKNRGLCGTFDGVAGLGGANQSPHQNKQRI